MRPASTEISLHTKRFFSAVFLSRLSGFLRDLAMAFSFGDNVSVAAFFVAFRLANLLRRLLGEGPFQAAFVPYFEGLRVQSLNKALDFFRRLSFLIAFFLIFATIAVEIILFILLKIRFFSPANQEIAYLAAWLFPAVIFICLYGLNLSFLQCFEIFFIPNLAPVICNLFWILGAFLLKGQPILKALTLLSQFVVAGFVGQWLVTLPQVFKQTTFRLRQWVVWEMPKEVKNLIKAFSVSAIGVGTLQINAFLDTLFARSADLKGPGYLWYSIRLEQLALAVFGIACINTVMPRLSRAIKEQDHEKSFWLFNQSYRRILVVMLFCSFTIIALGPSALNLLYGRGDFSALAVANTAFCLLAYGLGLVPAAMTILFSSVFYARNNFRLPMFFALLAVGLNIGLNALFVFILKLGPYSIALATSLSSLFNFYLLKKTAVKIGYQSSFCKRSFRLLRLNLTFISAFMAVFIVDHMWLHKTLLHMFSFFFTFNRPFFTRIFSEQLFHFSLLSLVFLVVLAVSAVFFKAHDLIEVFSEFFLKQETVQKTVQGENQS